MDSLLVQVNKILSTYTSNVNETMKSVINVTAKDAADKLRDTSPRFKGSGGGAYAKNWAVKRDKFGHATVYNKAPTYRLTHLLENGHDIIRDGKKVGEAAAKPHIKAVESWVQDEVVERLSEALG